MPKYNIDFEIMGLAVVFLIIVYLQLNYTMRSRRNLRFFRLCYSVMSAQIIDIITAYTITYSGSIVSPLVNMVLNTIYFISSACMGLFFISYILSCVFLDAERSLYDKICLGFFFCYLIFFVINFFNGCLFHFDRKTGEYIHGPLYLLLYIVPGSSVIMGLIIILSHTKKFTKKQLVSSFFFVFAVIFGTVLQMLFLSNVYLTLGLVALGLLIILFSMETPDYQKLSATMEELKIAREEADRANRVKGDFLAQMSHEIRTPINAILGMNEMIQRESDDSEVLAYSENIQSAGRILLTLINSILDFSKIEDGKMEILPIEYDTVSLLDDVINLIEERAEKKGLYVKWEIDNQLPSVMYGDDVRIRQIITNLLTNAVKYTQEGTVTLSVQEAGCMQDTIFLEISVRDTGIGIREEDKEKLFDSFSRLDEGKNRGIEGTGLGIVIVQSLLRMMGSTLEVDSEYEKGSDFHFQLAQKIVESGPIGNYRGPGFRTDKKKDSGEYLYAPEARILLVDDNSLNLMVAKGLLKRSAILVDTATGGMEAIQILKTKKYDVILLDHMMPDPDGIRTLQLIKDYRLINDETKVIVMTANAIVGAKEVYLKSGFDGYLAKPVDGEEMERTIAAFLPEEKVSFVKVGEEKVWELEEPTPQQKEEIVRAEQAVVIDRREGLIYAANDEEFYLEMLYAYADQSEERISELTKALEKGDARAYTIQIHGIKGNSKTIGAINFAEFAYEMEQAGKREDIEFLRENHDRLLREYRAVVQEIKA